MPTIAENLQRLVNAKASIANAITQKGGTVGLTDGFEEFPADIATIPSGGGSDLSRMPFKGITFYDYDGTIVAQYTKAELSVHGIPDNPSHEGLTAQGWNYDVVNFALAVQRTESLSVGQMYTTSDGKTRIYISLYDEGRLSPTLGLYINGSVDVDWGDGSAHGTMTGSSTGTIQTLQHTYSSIGDYVITLACEGSCLISGSSTDKRTYLLGVEDPIYNATIQKIHIGDVITFNGYPFLNCYGLTTITIPKRIASIPSTAFGNCFNLKGLVIPDSVTQIQGFSFQSCSSLQFVAIPPTVTSITGNYIFQTCTNLTDVTFFASATSIPNNIFQNCSRLKYATIPTSVTTIGSTVFANCSSLTDFIVPEHVASIGNNAFLNCTGLRTLKFEPTTPPTADTDTFAGIDPDCTIYVPQASLATYKSANNYPSSSTYTYVGY